MLQFLIDTTKRYEKSVKLLKNGKEIAQKQGDLDVVALINQIIKDNGLKLSDIGSIKANPGPGSFTGLKIGITIANVFNFFQGKVSLDKLQKPEYGSEPNIHKTKWLDE